VVDVRRRLGVAAAVLSLASSTVAVVRSQGGDRAVDGGGVTAAGVPPAAVDAVAAPPSLPSLPPAPPPTIVPVTVPETGPVPTPLPGCPPPPLRPGAGTSTPSWRPPVLVPESALPEPVAAPPVSAGLAPLEGKGMWVWKYRQTEAGDADAIVSRAVDAKLRQLWVRVGDSRDGFYAADVLDALVPRAHAAGLAVIGWGFPFLHDPVGDAAWSAEALAWRAPGGAALDGFSPDIELASEGVVLTERRARVYLGPVRQAAGPRMLVATVYRPTDRLWYGSYPYTAIAEYVDAFAPMVYWGCVEPGAATVQALERLAALRPVHVIGQAYDMAPDGGRAGPPSGVETVRFLDVARRRGAVGASFWVWQSIGKEQWDAVADFPWMTGG
jgi:hypothetical protein